MATAFPCASTMLMWLVPYSGCSGMRAKLLCSPAGRPGWATCIDREPIRRARRARYSGASRLSQDPAGGGTKSGSATYCARSANASRAASV